MLNELHYKDMRKSTIEAAKFAIMHRNFEEFKHLLDQADVERHSYTEKEYSTTSSGTQFETGEVITRWETTIHPYITGEDLVQILKTAANKYIDLTPLAEACIGRKVEGIRPDDFPTPKKVFEAEAKTIIKTFRNENPDITADNLKALKNLLSEKQTEIQTAFSEKNPENCHSFNFTDVTEAQINNYCKSCLEKHALDAAIKAINESFAGDKNLFNAALTEAKNSFNTTLRILDLNENEITVDQKGLLLHSPEVIHALVLNTIRFIVSMRLYPTESIIYHLMQTKYPDIQSCCCRDTIRQICKEKLTTVRAFPRLPNNARGFIFKIDEEKEHSIITRVTLVGSGLHTYNFQTRLPKSRCHPPFEEFFFKLCEQQLPPFDNTQQTLDKENKQQFALLSHAAETYHQCRKDLSDGISQASSLSLLLAKSEEKRTKELIAKSSDDPFQKELNYIKAELTYLITLYTRSDSKKAKAAEAMLSYVLKMQRSNLSSGYFKGTLTLLPESKSGRLGKIRKRIKHERDAYQEKTWQESKKQIKSATAAYEQLLKGSTGDTFNEKLLARLKILAAILAKKVEKYGLRKNTTSIYCHGFFSRGNNPKSASSKLKAATAMRDYLEKITRAVETQNMRSPLYISNELNFPTDGFGAAAQEGKLNTVRRALQREVEKLVVVSAACSDTLPRPSL